MDDGLVWVRRLSCALPDEVHARIFEPALEDLRADGLCEMRETGRAGIVRTVSFHVSALRLLVHCGWIGLVQHASGRSMRDRRALDERRERLDVDTLLQDARYAGRMLLKNAGLTSLAVLSLTLGIGANTAVFSLIEALMLRPLPYTVPDHVVRVWGDIADDGGVPRLSLSVPKFEHVRDHARSFTAVAADLGINLTLTGLGDPVQVGGERVTSNYFDLLGVQPLFGRTFLPGEEEGGTPVAIVTRRFWLNRLQSDPAAVGRAITLDGVRHTIVGIVRDLPVSDVARTEVFVTRPFALPGLTDELRQRGRSFLRVTARLKPDIAVAQAGAEMRLLADQYQQSRRDAADAGWGLVAVPLRDDLDGGLKLPIFTLFGAVCFVLLIACGNVANLLTARFTGRRGEIALRAALGASRVRIVRLFLVESLWLSACGAAFGLLAARAGLRVLPGIGLATVPIDGPFDLNGTVVAFTLGMALLTGVLVGLVPAIRASRPAPAEALRDGGRGLSDPRGHRVRSVLVACQMAVSLVLLVGAGLLLASFLRVQREAPGFDLAHVFRANVSLPVARYSDGTSQNVFFDTLLDRIRATPGVRAAGLIYGLPLSGWEARTPYAVADRHAAPMRDRPLGLLRTITPGYFSALSIPFLAGRDLSIRDRADTAPVAIISRSAALRLFSERDPIGRVVYFGPTGNGTPTQVVGVVGDVRSVSLAQANDVEFYVPFTQHPYAFATLAVRTAFDPAMFERTASTLTRGVDPQLPLNEPGSLESLVVASLGQRRLLTSLLVLFAALAVSLAVVGIYSVLTFLVGQRTLEIGIRVALGARRSDVFRLVTGEAVKPVAAGLLMGLVGVAILAKLLASQLYGISPFDAGTLTKATVGLGLVAMFACLGPARRAARVDPIITLRPS
jgi:predicted permease